MSAQVVVDKLAQCQLVVPPEDAFAIATHLLYVIAKTKNMGYYQH
jgi:hypothetical protein